MAIISIRYPDSNKEEIYPLDKKKLLIGRDNSADIIVESEEVSKSHAIIYLKKDIYYIKDLESTNGIIVNGKKVSELALKDGDEINIGSVNLKFVDEKVSERVIEEIINIINDSEEEEADNLDLGSSEKMLESQVNHIVNVIELKNYNINTKPLINITSDFIDSYRELLAENAKLKNSAKAFKTLLNIVEFMSSIKNERRLLTTILETVIKLFKAKRGFIMLYNKELNRLVPYVSHNMGKSKTEEEFSSSIANKVFFQKQGVITSDAMDDPRFMYGQSVINYGLHSVMCVPLNVRGKTLGVLYLDNKESRGCFKHEDLEFLLSFATQAAVSIENARLYQELRELYLSTIKILITALEAKDAYTQGHSKRVAEYALGIAKVMRLSYEECEKLEFSALLHDIGKIGIKDKVLNKKENLTQEEYDIIKQHPLTGAKIMTPLALLADKVSAVKYHHERWDGKGYPEGLKGEDIPLLARIIAVADTFDAMTTNRPYRAAMSLKKAAKEIFEKRGSQFDPLVVKAFMKYLKIRLMEKKSFE